MNNPNSNGEHKEIGSTEGRVEDEQKINDSGDPGRTPGKAEGAESGNASGSGSPGRTPGMAEGEDDPQETGEA